MLVKWKCHFRRLDATSCAWLCSMKLSAFSNHRRAVPFYSRGRAPQAPHLLIRMGACLLMPSYCSTPSSKSHTPLQVSAMCMAQSTHLPLSKRDSIKENPFAKVCFSVIFVLTSGSHIPSQDRQNYEANYQLTSQLARRSWGDAP